MLETDSSKHAYMYLNIIYLLSCKYWLADIFLANLSSRTKSILSSRTVAAAAVAADSSERHRETNTGTSYQWPSLKKKNQHGLVNLPAAGRGRNGWHATETRARQSRCQIGVSVAGRHRVYLLILQNIDTLLLSEAARTNARVKYYCTYIHHVQLAGI